MAVAYTRIIFFFLCCLAVMEVNAQAVSGTVKDSAGNAIRSANILVKNQEDRIVLFRFSDAKGEFVLQIPDSLYNNGYIEVTASGYRQQKSRLEPGRQSYDFVLKVAYKELQEVTVELKQPIKVSGDTLSYDVESFAEDEDRSIGDVIKRLPGLTVGEDGTITFNGKRISNLLIHNDDLMAGSYGLAPKTISKEMIERVEVIKHHQPILALGDRVFSDDIVVNLTLKDANALKLSGRGRVGGGIPGLVNLATDLILLNQTYKGLNSIRYNNSGEDYRNDMKNLVTAGASPYPDELLSDGTIDNPGLPLKYINRNNTYSINTNNLYNAKDSLQFRSNIRFVKDRNRLDYRAYTESYLPGDTVVFDEMQSILRRPYEFDLGLTVTKNKRSYYITNGLQVNLKGYTNDSRMSFNGEDFPQRISMKQTKIANNFNWVPDFGQRDVLFFNWKAGYYNAPQSLDIGSGIDSVLLNNNVSYRSVQQQAEIPTWISQAVFNYNINNGKLLQQSYQVGAENKWQYLNSSLDLWQHDGMVTRPNDGENDVSWRRDDYFLKANYSLRKSRLLFSLSVPLTLQRISFDQQREDNTQKTRFVVQPELRSIFYFKGLKHLAFNYSRHNSLGEIGDVYRGLILKNFRLITANEAFVREQRSDDLGISFNVERAVSMLFFGTGLQYRNTAFNAIPTIEYRDNIQRTVLTPLHNRQTDLTGTADISKYIFSLRTKAGLGIVVNRQHTQQFINNNLLPFQALYGNLRLSLNSKITDFLSLNYEASAGRFSSRQQKVPDNTPAIHNRVSIHSQQMELVITPSIPLYITFRGAYQLNKTTGSHNDYFFIDGNIRYRAKKLRTDLEFDIDNLLNVRSYNILSTTTNLLNESVYRLRGRMFLLKATFNF